MPVQAKAEAAMIVVDNLNNTSLYPSGQKSGADCQIYALSG
jgi:hypothetical protein